MKEAASVLKIIIPLLVFAVACNHAPTNLLVNGSAEISRYDTVPKGWENIEGNWTSAKLDSAKDIVTPAQSGSYFFFGHIGVVCILQQDVDVSRYTKAIDEKRQKFIIKGFEQTLDQGPLSDQGMLKVQCLDASENKTLYRDSTDTLMSVSKWQAITDTFLAPLSTRFIRVQLVAFRHIGNDNDAYFDNISLMALPTQNYLLFIIIIAAIILIAGLAFYFRKRKPKINTN